MIAEAEEGLDISIRSLITINGGSLDGGKMDGLTVEKVPGARKKASAVGGGGGGRGREQEEEEEGGREGGREGGSWGK